MHKYLLFLAAMLFCSCSADNEAKAETPTMNKIYITIDGQTQSATLVDNDATRELVAALQNAPITVTLNDNDFEIWGSLGKSLTTPETSFFITAATYASSTSQTLGAILV